MVPRFISSRLMDFCADFFQQRLTLFLWLTAATNDLRNSGRVVPEAKNQGKIISRRPTRSRVTKLRLFPLDYFPYISENLFPLAPAFSADDE